MKWLLVLMVLANVAFGAWRLLFAHPVEPTRITTEAVLPGHVNRLLLIGELEEERLRERRKTGEQASEDDEAVARAGSEGAASCFSVGPLDSQESVDAVGTWLAELDGALSLREDERREVSRFWVYLPPFPTRAEAITLVEEMVRNDVEDIYVIPRGDMANAISLGLYSRESSLERRLSELRSKGYEPLTAPRYVSKKSSWYDVELETDVAQPLAAFAESFPEIDASQTRCS